MSAPSASPPPDAKPPKKPYTGTQAVGRAVMLIEQFTVERPLWRVAALAKATGLNRTTTYRLLSALEAAEWVVRDPEMDAYRLGPGLVAVGLRAQGASKLNQIALPMMQALARDTNEVVTLEMLSGDQMVVLEQVSFSSNFVGNEEGIGQRFPLHAAATGKAVAAHLDPAELDRMLGDTLKSLASRTVTDRSKLRRQLRQIRVSGYAVTRNELEEGLAAVGAPIFDSDGRATAAISVSGPLFSLSLDRLPGLGRRLIQVAAEISHQLGHRIANPDASSYFPRLD